MAWACHYFMFNRLVCDKSNILNLEFTFLFLFSTTVCLECTMCQNMPWWQIRSKSTAVAKYQSHMNQPHSLSGKSFFACTPHQPTVILGWLFFSHWPISFDSENLLALSRGLIWESADRSGCHLRKRSAYCAFLALNIQGQEARTQSWASSSLGAYRRDTSGPWEGNQQTDIQDST